jgi:LIVCS family branched-chain amino acid:cation transporter
MNLSYRLQIFIVGMAIFSMFFGGGNLTFPLWIGSETSSVTFSSVGFLLSGVLLPFYGIVISLYFKGNYEEFLNVCGKTIGTILLFVLLVFWIPLGSGPRCNQLAYGAFCCQTGRDIPLWAYSLAYSIVVYILTYRETRVIEILGKFITPILVLTLFILFLSLFIGTPIESSTIAPVIRQTKLSGFNQLLASFFAGYHTMDFIAAIFFSSTVIALIKERQKERFNIALVRNACFFAITLLSIIYIGLISVGHANAEVLASIPKDRLLAVIGQTQFAPHFQIIIFIIITFSVLSTSIALSLVFSDYLRKSLFKEKLDHKSCLFISVAISFLLSIVGFDMLAVLISYAMSIVYPSLLFITTFALGKSLFYTNRKQKLDLKLINNETQA